MIDDAGGVDDSLQRGAQQMLATTPGHPGTSI